MIDDPANPASTAPSDAFRGELLGIDPRRLMQITHDCCTILEEYRNEMGIELGSPEPVAESWAWRRRCYRSEYAGKFYHRKGMGGVFDAPGGNLSLGIPARFVRQLAAKHADDEVGTDPFVAIMPAKISDAVRRALSKQVEKKVQDELSRSNIKPVLEETIRVALTENERAVKLAWVVDKTQRPELRPVAVMAGGGGEEGESGRQGEGATQMAPSAEEPEPDVDSNSFSPSPTRPLSPSSPTPIRTPKGDFIFQGDDLITTIADPASGEVQGLYDEKTTPVPPGMVVQLRARKAASFILGTGVPTATQEVDEGGQPVMAFVWSGGMVDAQGKLTFATVPGLIGFDTHKDQLEANGLRFEDFLYDIKAATLDDSTVQCHVYDADLEDVLADFRGAAQLSVEDPGPGYAAVGKALFEGKQTDTTKPEGQAYAVYAKIVAGISETSPLAGASQGNTDAGERYGSNGSQVRKKLNVHEAYYRVRVNPTDRYPSWLFLVIDWARRVPLYAEYLGNMRMKKPPFRLIRGLESEPGRAYGVGVYQKFEKRNLAVDYWFNRAKLKTTKDASADFIHKHALAHAQDKERFTVGGTDIYELVSNAASGTEWGPNHPPLFRVNLHEVNEKEWDLLEKLVQTGIFEFGLADIGQLAEEGAGIAQGATATATRNVERTGNTLQRATENMHAADITDLVGMAVDIILENADLGTAEFTDDGKLIAGLNRDEIRDLARDVRLLLTKARSAESLETNTQVKQTIIEYYSLPPSLRKHIRAPMVAILGSLFVPDADEVLVEPTEADLKAEADANAAGKDEKKSITLAFADLMPSEQAQVLEQYGIKPDRARELMEPKTGKEREAERAGAGVERGGDKETRRGGENTSPPHVIPGLQAA